MLKREIFREKCYRKVFKGKYFIGKKGFKGVASDSSIKQLARERGLPRGSPYFC